MRLLIIPLLFAASVVNPVFGQSEHDLFRLYGEDKCGEDGGCFYWNRKQCLWAQDATIILFPRARKIVLEEVGPDRIENNVHFQTYKAQGYKVRLLSSSFGSCHGTEAEQCTVIYKKVRIEVTGPKGREVFTGIGYCGS